jgi:hypothetical protein
LGDGTAGRGGASYETERHRYALADINGQQHVMNGSNGGDGFSQRAMKRKNKKFNFGFILQAEFK